MGQHIIDTYVIHVTTTGSAGSASGSGNTTSPVNGLLLGVYLDYNGSAPATTDLTVTLSNPGRTILTMTNTVTDAWVPLREQAKDNTGAAIAGIYELVPIDDVVTVSLAQCDALTDAVVAYLKVLKE